MSLDSTINARDRKFRVVKINPAFLTNMISMFSPPRFFMLTEGLPPTAKLERVHFNPLGGDLEMIFSDDSFAPVGDCGVIPPVTVNFQIIQPKYV